MSRSSSRAAAAFRLQCDSQRRQRLERARRRRSHRRHYRLRRHGAQLDGCGSRGRASRTPCSTIPIRWRPPRRSRAGITPSIRSATRVERADGAGQSAAVHERVHRGMAAGAAPGRRVSGDQPGPIRRTLPRLAAISHDAAARAAIGDVNRVAGSTGSPTTEDTEDSEESLVFPVYVLRGRESNY